MYVLQKPSAQSLSSTMLPLLLDSQEDVSFTLKKGADILIKENYSPTAEYQIGIRDIGKVCQCYLQGKMDLSGKRAILQDNIAADFTMKYALLEDTVSVLKCKAVTSLDAADFYGKRFLNMQQTKKSTSLHSEEYLSFYCNAVQSVTIQYSVYREGVVSIVAKSLAISNPSAGFYTLNVSPASLFLLHGIRDCIGYSVFIPNGEKIEYMLLPETQEVHHFKYRNVFDLPETFTSMGSYTLEIESDSESVVIEGVEERLGITRSDKYEFTFGALHNQSDFALISEMLSSEELYFKLDGSYRKIVVTEQKIPASSNKGSLKEWKVSFKLADTNANIMLL